ncbi:DUF4412 domain-containing protein [Roseomonas marmotae]|uniref:DUF4412 domain-containing protein n=1 Tax=Roseomonas marmotae TaxID=2768161 RepID=A0ABS3KFX6_9PROT|nr:DUF4412 domain-containing protein [Roseomonas marmotae]MBO1075815.1 DUF4412 domain-containing protein [Roseomonas marmotae]QTI81991.1 DUF4412 domain-containing protein [Roseomonas marmotae]
MIQRLATALLAPMLLAAPALAQQSPQLLPSRDVAVTFRLSGGNRQPGDIHATWLASQRVLRVDNASAPGWLMVDQPTQRAYMVMEDQRLVMRLPAAPEIAMLLDRPESQGRVTRLGRRTIAGAGCTDWQIERRDGKGGVACLTADGVLLRAQQTGRQEVLEATRVTYGPQDPSRFRLPQGFPQLQLPAGLRGLRLPG